MGGNLFSWLFPLPEEGQGVVVEKGLKDTPHPVITKRAVPQPYNIRKSG